MARAYTKEEREKLKKKFLEVRRKGKSIKASARAAGISVSTYYTALADWCWSKDCGWTKGSKT